MHRRQVILFVVLLLAGGAMMGPLWAGALGWRMGPVVGHSMAPYLTEGELVVLQRVDAHRITEGDVIAFEASDASSGLVLHRVVDRVGSVSDLHFRTKGDGNKYPDPQLVSANNVRGRLAFHCPKVGFLLVFVQQDWRKATFLSMMAGMGLLALGLGRPSLRLSPPRRSLLPGPLEGRAYLMHRMLLLQPVVVGSGVSAVRTPAIWDKGTRRSAFANQLLKCTAPRRR